MSNRFSTRLASPDGTLVRRRPSRSLALFTVHVAGLFAAAAGGAGTATAATGDSAVAAAPNPNPSRITAESWWLMEQMLALESGTRNGGIYVDKPGYHNTRAGNASDDYSVRDPEDKGGPSDKAAGYDWTFPEAQGGSYGTISRYSQRLLAAGRADDPRVAGWKEFFGQADSDQGVEGWDFRDGESSTSDSSHLWHIHLSEDRDKVTSMDNKRALLSVLKGESLAEWRSGGTLTGTPADITGDGWPDLIARWGDGNLYLYRHTGNAAAPYGGGIQIGTARTPWAYSS